MVGTELRSSGKHRAMSHQANSPAHPLGAVFLVDFLLFFFFFAEEIVGWIMKPHSKPEPSRAICNISKAGVGFHLLESKLFTKACFILQWVWVRLLSDGSQGSPQSWNPGDAGKS